MKNQSTTQTPSTPSVEVKTTLKAGALVRNKGGDVIVLLQCW